MRNNLKGLRRVLARLAAAHPIKGDVAKSDAVRSYFGLLTLGNSDFDAIENYRGDAFFKTSLGITLLPPVTSVEVQGPIAADTPSSFRAFMRTAPSAAWDEARTR